MLIAGDTLHPLVTGQHSWRDCQGCGTHPEKVSDLTNGPTSHEFSVCPFFKPFFGGISTEEGFKKSNITFYREAGRRFISLKLGVCTDSAAKITYSLRGYRRPYFNRFRCILLIPTAYKMTLCIKFFIRGSHNIQLLFTKICTLFTFYA